MENPFILGVQHYHIIHVIFRVSCALKMNCLSRYVGVFVTYGDIFQELSGSFSELSPLLGIRFPRYSIDPSMQAKDTRNAFYVREISRSDY